MEITTYFLGSLVAHVGALVVVASSLPTLEIEEDVAVSGPHVFRMVFADDVALGEEEEQHDRVGTACSCHDTMGDPDEVVGDGRYGVAGPADNPDPHLGHTFGPDGSHGTGHGDNDIVLSSLAPSVIWGRDDALGTDPISERGAMWGDEIAVAPGDGGLGGLRAAEIEEVSRYGYRCRMP